MSTIFDAFLGFFSDFAGEGEDLGLLGVLLADDPLTILLGVIVTSTIRTGLLDLDLDLDKDLDLDLDRDLEDNDEFRDEQREDGCFDSSFSILKWIQIGNLINNPRNVQPCYRRFGRETIHLT